MFYVAFIVLGVTVFYLYRLVTSSSGSQFDDNSIDAFIIKEDTNSKKDTQHTTSDKYKQDYTDQGRQILILFGTEYGCSEEIAKLLYDRVKDVNVGNSELCLQPRVINARDYMNIDFSREQLCFVVISTSGDGVPPTDARPFYDFLLSDTSLHHLKFSVLALGDSNYPQFCKTGRTVHERMINLGANCIFNRQDVDMEDWSVINKWINKATEYISAADLNMSLDYIQHGNITEEMYSRNKPFMATLKTKHLLTVCDNVIDKETIHCEFDITGSDLTWTSGDALGIYPLNNPSEVQYLIKAMHCSGKEQVCKPSWAYQDNNGRTESECTLSSMLLKYYDLKSVKLDLLESLKQNVTTREEKLLIVNLLEKDISQSSVLLQNYLKEREVADVLMDFKSHTLPLAKLLSCMKSLQPRYYSISSSPKMNSNQVCVTAAVVRYETLGRSRTGVTTTFINDRLNIGTMCPVFMSRNPDFRLPDDCRVPVILIGPGTGIAPFIAFIQEREMEASCGPVWLYFGCRHKEKDYLYKSQLEKWASDDVIRLSVAFSRDQNKKVYVQDHIQRDAQEIWQLIHKENASIFVCGDAKHMAHDVHMTLLNIVTEQGCMDKNDAVIYLQRMEENNRYQKDVWVV